MHKVPTTPQTLPCGCDEDQFFVFHEDGSIDVNIVGVEIGGNNTSNIFTINNSSYQEASPCHMKEDSGCIEEQPASTTTVEKQWKENDNSTRSSRSLPFNRSMRDKRRQYRSRLLSRNILSNIIKTAIQSPTNKARVSAEKSSRHPTYRNSFNDKDSRSYYCLEEEDESRNPDHYEDDRSVAHSLPLTSSLPWRKKSFANSSSSTSAVARVSKMKWNRVLQTDSLATFKERPGSLPTSISASKADQPANTMVAVKSCSTLSSLGSYNSSPSVSMRVDNGEPKKFLTQSPRLASFSPNGLQYSPTVDEDEEEDEDSDHEDEDHPAAGSFAFAIGRGEF